MIRGKAHPINLPKSSPPLGGLKRVTSLDKFTGRGFISLCHRCRLGRITWRNPKRQDSMGERHILGSWFVSLGFGLFGSSQQTPNTALLPTTLRPLSSSILCHSDHHAESRGLAFCARSALLGPWPTGDNSFEDCPILDSNPSRCTFITTQGIGFTPRST